MEYTSWYEENRIEHDEDEELARKKAKAIADEINWRASIKFKTIEDDIMRIYAHKCMEKELFSLGGFIEKNCADFEDRWWVAESVYQYYGIFCMMVRRPAEAIGWCLKALEYEVPYPYPTWELLAAAYAEVGDLEQADFWIERYMAHYNAEGNRMCHYEKENFAEYYFNTDRNQLALKMLLEISTLEKHYSKTLLPLLGRVYNKLREFDKAIDAFQEHLRIYKSDPDVFNDLAVAYYDGFTDIEQTTKYYLKSIDCAEEHFSNYVEWKWQVYDILATLHADNYLWEQCFYYLKQFFKTKYTPEEAAPLLALIDQLPKIENNDMGDELYDMVKLFESSFLRPSGAHLVEEKALENPTEEVKDAVKGKKERSQLFNLEDLSAN